MRALPTGVALLPDPFTTRAAQTVGVTSDDLRGMVRRGQLRRAHRGVYHRPDAPVSETTMQRQTEHLWRAARHLRSRPSHAASHVTAAVAHGLPALLHPQSPVHLTGVDVQPRSRREQGVLLHHCDSMPNEVLEVGGLRVMAIDRTVADCLRTLPAQHALALADAAVRASVVTTQQVLAVLAQQVRWRGRPQALATVPLIDGRRETWLESYSAAALHALGIDVPLPQVEVFDTEGRFVARVDGLWLDDATVGEADGLGKYGLEVARQLAGSAEAVVSHVLLEKGREDDLRSLGLEVVRWDTTEIRTNPDRVAARVRRARRRGDIRRFTGRLRLDGRWLDADASTGHRNAGDLGAPGT